MNYRHIYHAGNFADIVKHLTLISIIEQLKKKDKAFAVLDSFAGIGKYDISSNESLRSNETINGIQKLLKYECSKQSSVPDLIKKFLGLAIDSNNNNIYQGSPWIIHQMLRSQDRLIASELHPTDYSTLKSLFSNSGSKRQIHHQDAYIAIKAFVPFHEKRGLIFIDPPFEQKDEFDKLISILKIIKQRAANICTLIWYPIKNHLEIDDFHQRYQTIEFKETLIIEFSLSNTVKNMNKCGLLVANPPDIKSELASTMGYLVENVYDGDALVRIN